MAVTKRRDNKNRVLRNGETQRPDGRYCFSYYERGKQKCIYSWKLEKTDHLPSGKRDDLSLREKEAQLEHDKWLGLSHKNSHCTVSELLTFYLQTKGNIKDSTKQRYNYYLRIIGENPLGKQRVVQLNKMYAKQWFAEMQKQGVKSGTLQTIHQILKGACQLAEDDHWILHNPFEFKLGSIIRNDVKGRESLTEDQITSLFEFLQTDAIGKKYYDDVYILLHTGLRISEYCGLTKDDIDLERHLIRVEHQLIYINHRGFVMEELKTKNSKRMIPIDQDTEQCFLNLIYSNANKDNPVIEGYTNFISRSNRGTPMSNNKWNQRFDTFMQRYNEQGNLPIFQLSPHVLRHTFCTRLAKQGIDPKALQYLMGHANYATTMNYYTHYSIDDVQVAMIKMREGA